MIRRVLGVLRTASFIAPLLTRVVIGFPFFLGGRAKWQNLERTAGVFADLGIPAPAANAVFIALLEMIGGLLLIVGLGTRVVGSLLSCTMIVAIATAHREEFVKRTPRRRRHRHRGGDVPDVAPVAGILRAGQAQHRPLDR
jgi:uncharacterized membrane protein YphA (DoxX/SURF4 family)